MRRSLLLAVVFAVASAALASAQTIGTPIFKGPYRNFKHSELAGYLSDPGENVSLALEGEYRIARPSFDFGLRAAYLDGSGNNSGTLGLGIDGRATMVRHSDQFPLDGSFIAGFGALFSDNSSHFLIPLGISLGREVLLEGSEVSFTPYVAPVITPNFGDGPDDILLGLGIGVDIALSRSFDARVSGALGDYDGVGIGLAWHK
jgi:hypothetical protein